MLKSLEGIITKSIKYGESSVIFELLSSEGGLKSFIVGGIRKKGVKNKSALVSILNLVKVEAYVKDKDQLSRIKEISYAHVYKSIPFDVVKASIATLLVEICRKSIRASDDYRDVYNYIVKGLIHLDNTTTGIGHLHIRFLIGLTKYLGFEFNDNYNFDNVFFDLRDGSFKKSRENHRLCLNLESSLNMHKYISQKNYESIPRQERKLVLLGLIDYYRYHIEDFGELKSLPVLVSLYEN